MLLVSWYIMAATSRRQWIPFWLTLPKEGNRLITSTERLVELFFSHLIYNFILNTSTVEPANPFRRGSRGWGVF